MNISIATKKENAVIESLTDGTGIRLVLFVSGCPHHCKGCHNPKSWDIKNGIEISTEELANYLIDKYINGQYSGMTFSGGDPLFQSEALYELVTLIKKKIPRINIWCYTGYRYENVPDRKVLPLIDVLVDGPFEEDKKFPHEKFRGSYNQRILYLKNGQIDSKNN
mgnify:CR=1 FL=1